MRLLYCIPETNNATCQLHLNLKKESEKLISSKKKNVSQFSFYAPLFLLLISILREHRAYDCDTHYKQTCLFFCSSGSTSTTSPKSSLPVNFLTFFSPPGLLNEKGKAHWKVVSLTLLMWTLWLHHFPKEVPKLLKKTLEPDKITTLI